MTILMTGGTGFVGRNLTKVLTDTGHHVYITTRSPEKYFNTEQVTFISYDYPVADLPKIEAIINLAGDSLFGYWTKSKKEAIRKSRIETTQKVIEMMEQMEHKPEVLISGSAIGFYGTAEDLIFTEATERAGNDFLAEVVEAWERTASQAEQFGVRTVYARFGVILGEEGALPLMKLPIKLFAGGRIGSGEQWISWVHINDVVDMIRFCLANKQISGPVNVTAPHPARNKDFTNTLARVLRRPDWLPAPILAVRTALGDMSMLITRGQYVLPGKADMHGYEFSYPYLEKALFETEH